MSGTTFNSQAKTIGELLSSNTREKIVVPQFQRGYSWQKKHVEMFWKDIIQFQEESGRKDGPEKYFLGPIVVLRKSKDVTELLDGQQRLATATILFSVLRDVARAMGTKGGQDFARDIHSQLIEKEDAGYALEMGETDRIFFRELVQSDEPTARKPKIRTHTNIQNARQILMEKVKAMISPLAPPGALAELKALRQTLRSDLVMASIPVISERDAFRIFETLNDRGLRLSVPDLLLNYLMRQAPEGERKQIRDFWTEMIERMGRRDINRFLRHMWLSKYGDLKSIDLFTALKEHIEAHSIESLEFARNCADECDSYVHLLNADVEHLKDAAPLVRSLLQDLDFQLAVPVLLSAYLRLESANFEKVARWLLVFLTRYTIIANLESSGLETVLFKLARKIRVMLEPQPDEKEPDPKTVRECMAHIRAELVESSPSDEAVRVAMKELTLDGEEAKYVLGRLAVRMQTNTKEVKIDEANLEHIFPKNPALAEWGGKTNQEALEPVLWHIGNMTILGKRLNREAANKEFSVKREHYAQKSELEMAQRIATDYSVWNEATIKDRATKLAELAVEVWNFDNPSRV